MAYQRLQVNNAIKVIPSDTVGIPDPASFVLQQSSVDMSVAGVATLYVGGIGNVSVEMASQKNAGAISGVNPTIFSNVSQGSFMPILVTRVNDTSTTATLIKALF